jgi:hypothetical protein
MPLPRVVLAIGLWAAWSPPAPQDPAPQVLEEAWPDGSARLRCEARTLDGAMQRHGSYLRWHPGLVPAVEGAYADGLPSGAWKAWREDGSVLLAGTFHEGRRTGKWEHFHADGKLAAVGEYLLGCRNGRWVCFDVQGEKLESESGTFRIDKGNHPDRTRAWLGETRDDVRHGNWRTWWSNGVPQSEGSFRAGRRHGRLDFFLLDGTRETEFVTGVYVDGARSGEAEPETDPFRLPEERDALFAGATATDPAGLPRAARAPGVKNAERDSMREWVRRYTTLPEGDERRQAGLVLTQLGRPVVPELLEALRALDLADPGARALGSALNGEVLRGIAKASFPWDAAEGEAALALDRLAIVRWFSWWELVRENEAYWSALAATGEGAGPALLDLAWIDREASAAVEPAAGASAPAAALPALFEARRRAAESDPRRREIALALDWLARHQEPSGRWKALAFEALCQSESACGGPAAAEYDVGVSALALLAMLAQGNTAEQGTHADNVARGLTWLLSVQDPATGLFVPTDRHEFLYEHCMATEALAEAALFLGTPEASEALARAVRVIHQARNARGAWRYALPPDGENDTSVTSWAVSALGAAQRAGAEVDSNAFAGARWWIDRATDPKTGRIGYNTTGSLSARVSDKNQDYSPELTEAMSAAGLHVARVLGERHFEEASLERTRALLFARPPEWTAAGFTNDLYYWYHGAQALQGRRDAPSRKWLDALSTALEQGQRRDGHSAGSWDPNGPWGWAGGRVYSTATAALALSVDTRHAEPESTARRR